MEPHGISPKNVYIWHFTPIFSALFWVTSRRRQTDRRTDGWRDAWSGPHAERPHD